MNKDKRTCFNCKYFKTCYVFKTVHKATQEVKMNIDADKTPGQWMDIFYAIGNCCMEYELDEV